MDRERKERREGPPPRPPQDVPPFDPDYDLIGTRPGDLVKMDILVNADRVDALSVIVHRDKAEARGRKPSCARARARISVRDDKKERIVDRRGFLKAPRRSPSAAMPRIPSLQPHWKG